jgi:hypothetical protein
MMRAFLPWVGTGLLIVSASGLGMAALQPMRSIDSPVIRVVPDRPTGSLESDTLSLLPPRPAAYYLAIMERPLFAPSRRPAEQQALEVQPVARQPEEPAEPQRPRPSLRLLGMMSNGASTSALISVDGGEATWITQGEPVAEWALSAIGPNWIELSLNGDLLHLDLYPK